MSYRLLLQPRAIRAIENLPGEIQARLKAAISKLGDTPRPRGAKKLRGKRETWRIRVADFRILYVPDDARRILTVTVVGHRRDVYR